MRFTVPDDGALPDFSDVVRYYPNTAEDILCHTNNMCKISIFRWFPLCFELYGIPSMLECDWDAQKYLYKIASNPEIHPYPRYMRLKKPSIGHYSNRYVSNLKIAIYLQYQTHV